MEAIRRKGGSFCVVSRRKTRKQGEEMVTLLFSNQISRELFERKFFYASLKFKELFHLEITFSPNPERPTKVWFSNHGKVIRAEIPVGKEDLPLEFFSLGVISLPYLQRRGMVSLNGNVATVVFPFLGRNLFPKTNLVLPPVGMPTEECSFYFNSQYGLGQLCFRINTSKKLKKIQARGARIERIKNFLILTLENNCFFSCKKCPRVNCLPIIFRQIGNYHQALISVRGLFLNLGVKKETLDTFSGTTGKVWWIKSNLIVIEVPFL